MSNLFAEILKSAPATGTPSGDGRAIRSVLAGVTPAPRVQPQVPQAEGVQPMGDNVPLTEAEVFYARELRMSPSEFRRYRAGEDVRELLSSSEHYRDKKNFELEWQKEKQLSNQRTATFTAAKESAEQKRVHELQDTARQDALERPEKNIAAEAKTSKLGLNTIIKPSGMGKSFDEMPGAVVGGIEW
jgi:hypothetical protein